MTILEDFKVAFRIFGERAKVRLGGIGVAPEEAAKLLLLVVALAAMYYLFIKKNDARAVSKDLVCASA